MMPVVRLPDDLFQRLQCHATPLVDSVGDVLTRILDGYEAHLRGLPTTTIQTLTSTAGNESDHDPEINSFADLWLAVAKRFNEIDPPVTTSETLSMASFKQVRVGKKDIHYEWALRKRDKCIDVCLHFEGPERGKNLLALHAVQKHKEQICDGIPFEFHAEAWAKNWAQLMFRIPYEGAFPNRALVLEAAELMKKLIVRTWGLVKDL